MTKAVWHVQRGFTSILLGSNPSPSATERGPPRDIPSRLRSRTRVPCSKDTAVVWPRSNNEGKPMPLLNLFWTMFIFFMWVIWIWLLITVFIDIFRDKGLNGFAKAAWLLFVLFLPLLGVLVYLIARGDEMSERQVQHAVNQQKAFRAYVQEASADGSTADELEKLGKLKDQGVLTSDEFDAQKAKLLA